MKRSSPVRIAFIVLLVTVACIVFEHLMGYNTTRHETGQYVRMLPALVYWVSIFIVVKNEKRKTGTLTFKEGWKAGVVSSLVYSIGFTIVIIVYQQFFNPEFYETIKAFSITQLQARNATPEETTRAMNEIEMSYSGSALSYMLLFVFSFVWGVVLSAIAALIFKSKSTANSPQSTVNSQL